jgi:hypothetical protein
MRTKKAARSGGFFRSGNLHLFCANLPVFLAKTALCACLWRVTRLNHCVLLHGTPYACTMPDNSFFPQDTYSAGGKEP